MDIYGLIATIGFIVFVALVLYGGLYRNRPRR